jgi:hypothetical protein
MSRPTSPARRRQGHGELYIPFTVLHYAALAFTALFVGLAFYGFATSVRYVALGQTAVGRVISVTSETEESYETEVQDGDSRTVVRTSTTFTQTIEFSDARGRAITFSTTIDASRYSTGDSIEVIYLPERAEEAKVASCGSLWGGNAFLMLMGVLCYPPCVDLQVPTLSVLTRGARNRTMHPQPGRGQGRAAA